MVAYNIKDYGAVPSDQLQTEKIQAAIDACFLAGGGEVVIPAGIFINRYGYRRGVVFGLTLFGLGALAFIPGNTFYAFLAALFVIGCGLTFLETAANPYVTELGPKETASSRLTCRRRSTAWAASWRRCW